jgi:uncharacterized protein with PIN domain
MFNLRRKVMSQNDFNAWSTEKAKELFSISHKLMDAAKQLSEHHAEELKANIEHALHLATLSAQSDFAKLKDIQTRAAEESTERMMAYQAKVKGILKQVNKETAQEADKYLDKARTALHDYLDQASQKIPVGGSELSKLIKDVSDAGAKVYKEGRKMVDHALENAEVQVDEFAKKTAAATKKTSTGGPTAAKASARKTTH